MKLEKFKIVVMPLREKLFNYAWKITESREDAEDIVQETFLKLWYMRDKLDGYLQVEALAMSIARNLSIDLIRTHKTNVSLAGVSVETPTLNPEVQLIYQDAADCVRDIIASLPGLQQTIIRMKDIEGYELSEIAQITGTQIEAVRMNLSRARKKVRDLFLKMNAKAVCHEYR